MTFVKGQVLYPEIRENNLTLTLLTCKKAVALKVPGFKTYIGNGEIVIAGFSNAQAASEVTIIVSIENETRQPQLLWQRK
jgi:hypothetical protein